MRLSVATRAKIALTTAIAIAAAYYATADPPRAFYILHRHADAIRAVLADELPETADPRRASILWVDGVGARALRGAPSPPWQRISRLDGVTANQTAICSALAAAALEPACAELPPHADTCDALGAPPTTLAADGSFAAQLFVLVAGVEPLRVFVHSEGVRWRAAAVGDDDDWSALPFDGLWTELANASAAAALWRSLEVAAASAAVAALPPRPRRPGRPNAAAAAAAAADAPQHWSGAARASRRWQLMRATLLVDVAALRPRLLSLEPDAPLPLTPTMPAWHASLLRRVASHALNLTGAVAHPRRRDTFSQVQAQMREALAVHKPHPRHKRRVQKKENKKEARSSKEQGGKKGREHKQQQEQQPPQRGQKPPPSCEFSIRGSERDDDGGWRRSCASRAEIDDLAAVEAEYQWRLGFRRVVPGPAAEAAAALRGDRPASKADELLGDFDRMWPKEADPGGWDRIDEG